MKGVRRLLGISALCLFASALAAPSPLVSIQSPADPSCTNASSISVVVSFQANPGNVKDVQLLVNGQVVQTFTNPPNVKSGTHTFTLALGAYPEGTLLLQAQAFQGNQNAGLKGVSGIVHLEIDRAAPMILGLTPAQGSTVDDATPECSALFADAGCGVVVCS